MRHLSLCSGIGAADLAARELGWTNVAQVELDPYCRAVLTRHYPDTDRHEDLKTFDGLPYRDTIDVLSGGYPCQPFSTQGNRKGKEDPRHLWPYVYRAVRDIRPRWAVFENVLGHVSLGLDDVLADLAEEGYTCWPLVLEALSFGAAHRRARVFVVARRRDASDAAGRPRRTPDENGKRADALDDGRDSGEALRVWQGTPPALCCCDGVPHGIPLEVHRDRKQRMKALGNAICPPVIYAVFKAIQQADSLPTVLAPDEQA